MRQYVKGAAHILMHRGISYSHKLLIVYMLVLPYRTCMHAKYNSNSPCMHVSIAVAVLSYYYRYYIMIV